MNPIYYDTYTTSRTSAKTGDALGDTTTTNPGCSGWHLATGSSWVNSWYDGYGRKYYIYFVRGNVGIFSVGTTASGHWVDTAVNYSARGVASCGQGL